MLAALGALLVRLVPATDLVARWGGEEFIVALLSGTPERHQRFAERLRESVAAMVVPDAGGDPIPVTASFGLATAEVGDSLESVVDRADRAMYAAKTVGRNRVMIAAGDGFEPLVVPGPVVRAA